MITILITNKLIFIGGESFNITKQIGTGSYAKIFLIEGKKSKNIFALKVKRNKFSINLKIKILFFLFRLVNNPLHGNLQFLISFN